MRRVKSTTRKGVRVTTYIVRQERDEFSCMTEYAFKVTRVKPRNKRKKVADG